MRPAPFPWPVRTSGVDGAPDTEAGAGTPIDPTRLRRRAWWSTVGVCYGVGAYLSVVIAFTARDPWVAAIAVMGSAVGAAASARLLQRHLPGEERTEQTPAWLTAGLRGLAVAGAVATVIASQWATEGFGGVVAGLATSAIAAQVPPRRRVNAVTTGAVVTFALVAAAHWVEVGPFDRAVPANQALVAAAVAAGLLVTLWFWQLVDRLERARRLEADLAVADERLRFAADLHDVQGHQLQVIALQSELAARLATTDPQAAAAQMGEVHEHARRALADTRELVQGYRRTRLREELTNAVRVLDAVGIDGRVDSSDATGAVETDDSARQLLGLVVREATTNILRHSHAGRARLLLDARGAELCLTIRNDGATAAPGPGSGAGLTVLAERFEAAGGRFDWHHQDGWFTVTAGVPIAEATPA